MIARLSLVVLKIMIIRTFRLINKTLVCVTESIILEKFFEYVINQSRTVSMTNIEEEIKNNKIY